MRWYDHNDLNSLESVLQAVDKETKKKRTPLTRRFIVTEGIFENDGAMIDLPKLVSSVYAPPHSFAYAASQLELKQRYKFRLVLDESYSFGTVGRTGRGLTELYNVPATSIDMLVGSMANGLCASGGFCAGSKVVVDHQRINGTSFVFSAAMPALLAVSASVAIGILTDRPSAFERLRENVQAVRSTLHGVEGIEILSHPISAIVHIALKSDPAPPNLLSVPMQTSGSGRSNPASIVSAKGAVTFDWQLEEKILQEVVDEALNAGVLITRAKKLRGQELVEVRPTIRLAVSSALTKTETEKAAATVKSAFVKVLSRRR